MSVGTKLNCASNNSGLNNNKKKIYIKNENFAFFKGKIYTRGIFPMLFINAPKWRQSAGNINSRVMQRFQLLIVRKTTKLKKKQILKCLPNLWEALIEVQSFHSICLRIHQSFSIVYLSY